MKQQVSTLVARLGCSALFVAALGCGRDQPTTVSASDPQPSVAGAQPRSTSFEVPSTALRSHIESLTGDVQDAKVQGYIIGQMQNAGLKPGFGQAYRQKFWVTDGVTPKDPGGSMLDASGLAIPHSLVPFSRDTSVTGPTVSKMVFVGHGLASEGLGTGDYTGLTARVRGKIVVALHGAPGDSELTAEQTTPESKVQVAREHGAKGFVLWDPTAGAPWANHGKVSDPGLPVVFVGAVGNAALVEAFTGLKGVAEVQLEKLPVRRGGGSRKVATIQTNVAPRKIQTANVAGLLPGNGTSDTVVVVGAPMHHRGLGAALAPDSGDHASGVAVMLEVCRTLWDVEPAKRPFDVLCMAFGGESTGRVGSKHFVENLEGGLKARLSAVVNFGAVGRLRENTVMVAGVGSSSQWENLVEKNRGSLKVSITEDHGGVRSWFAQANVAELHFSTRPVEGRSRSPDEAGAINVAGSKRVAEMALGVLRQIQAEAIILDDKRVEPASSPRQDR